MGTGRKSTEDIDSSVSRDCRDLGVGPLGLFATGVERNPRELVKGWREAGCVINTAHVLSDCRTRECSAPASSFTSFSEKKKKDCLHLVGIRDVLRPF